MNKSTFSLAFFASVAAFLAGCVFDPMAETLENRENNVSGIDLISGSCPKTEETFKVKSTEPNIYFTAVICVDSDKDCPEPKNLKIEDFEPFMGVHSEAVLKKYNVFDSVCKGSCDRDSTCFLRLVKTRDTKIEKHSVFDKEHKKEFKEEPTYCATCAWATDADRKAFTEILATILGGGNATKQRLLYESIIDKKAPWRTRDHVQKCCAYKISNLGVKCDCDEWPVFAGR